MTLTCAAVRSRLQAYHDRELPVSEQIAVGAHLDQCPPCEREARGLVTIGDALRTGASGFDCRASMPVALDASVITQLKAERHESMPARIGRLFEDLHLVYAGLGAIAASVMCIAVMLAMLHYASPERSDSLAAVLQVLSSSQPPPPPPVAAAPRPRTVDLRTVMPVMLVPRASDGDTLFTLAGVVSEQGTLIDLSLVQMKDEDRETVTHLLNAVSAAGFRPLRVDAQTINLIWLLAHTTVRGKQHS
jgi:anti-sigma factor RsiW